MSLLGGISGVVQWLACWTHNPKVRGSKPRPASFVMCFSRQPAQLVAFQSEAVSMYLYKFIL